MTRIEIEKEAKNLLETKGTPNLRITVSVKGHDDSYYTLDTDVSFWHNGRFFIPEKLRNKISKCIRNMVQCEIDEYIGEPLKMRNDYSKLIQDEKKWYKLCWMVAASGWGFAAGFIFMNWLL